MVFQSLNRDDVRYLLIGGTASVIHGLPHTTVDVDLALDPDLENIGRPTGLRRLGLESLEWPGGSRGATPCRRSPPLRGLEASLVLYHRNR